MYFSRPGIRVKLICRLLTVSLFISAKMFVIHASRLKTMNITLKPLLLLLLLICLVFWNATTNCFAQSQQEELIPAFVDLPFNHNIMPDEYLSVIKSPQADLRIIAASLMERKRRFIERWDTQSQKPEPEENFPRSFNDFELVCFYPDQYLDSLIKQGQLNVHQVGHSRGYCDAVVRARAEDFFLGIHLENQYNGNKDSKLHYLRPKYGFVLFLKPCSIKVNPFRLIPYGQIIIVYKDEVKYRTSYTYGDSLASYSEPWAITLHPHDPVPLSILRLPGKDDTAFCRYVEAQIWGPIDLTDIKEFRIPKGRQDLVQKLAPTGIPVFSYNREVMELTDTFIDVSACGWQRGEPLNEPASEQLSRQKSAGAISQ